MDVRAERAEEEERRPACAGRRTTWKRKVPLFAENKGILEAEPKQRLGIAEDTARRVADRIAVEVNKTKRNEACKRI